MKSSFTTENLPRISLSGGKEPAPASAAETGSLSDLAKSRIGCSKGDPFLFADWEQVMFLHFLAAPEVIQPFAPAPLELDLFQGNACITLVALTMRHFRPCRQGSIGCLLRPLLEQRFLNLRTYVRHGNEPGALFLWGWLSRPWCSPLASALFGLPYTFASIKYDHQIQAGQFRGLVTQGTSHFAYTATARPGVAASPCAPHSLGEFAMERYSGFFSRKHETRVFRAWHPLWLHIPVETCIEDNTLVTSRFPWFKEATFTSANFAAGFKRVWVGKPHPITESCGHLPRRHVVSSFYEMP